MRVATYNVAHIYHPAWDDEARVELVHRVIADEIQPDVLLVQELHADDDRGAIASIHTLAEATGLRCTINESAASRPTYTVAKGYRSPLAVGILWKSGIEPVVDSWQTIQPEKFWHACGKLTLDVGGVLVDHAVYHGPPWADRTDPSIVLQDRLSEAQIIGDVLTSSGQNPFTIAGADWNVLSADKLGNDYYDYVRPPVGLDPGRAALAQNRQAGEILLRSGLIDVAPALPGASLATRQLTTGHNGGGTYGGRRIDGFRVRPEMLPAMRRGWVITSEAAKQASDHLPYVVEYETAALLGA